MITKDETLYVTIAVRRHSDRTLRVLLPEYDRAISVHEDSSDERGHRPLYIALEWLLGRENSN